MGAAAVGKDGEGKEDDEGALDGVGADPSDRLASARALHPTPAATKSNAAKVTVEVTGEE